MFLSGLLLVPGCGGASPGGWKIVFPGRPYGGLSVIGADGKGERALTRSDEDSSPAWSPDGRRLAFVRTPHGGNAVMVMLVDLDGRRLHVLRRLDAGLEQLHWSPDGRSLTLLEHPADLFGRGDLVTLAVAGGRVLGRIAPGSPAASTASPGLLARPAAGLSGRDLVALRGGRLLVYDASSFRLRRNLRVGRRARLAGVSDGLVAWVAGAEVHLLRLRDGRGGTIRTTSRSAVEAALTSAGLFYAVHPRPVPRAQVAPFRPDPATVVFVRRAALPLKR